MDETATNGRTTPVPKEPIVSADLCGCGRPVRYLGHDGIGACNKYGRCMTWEQQHERIKELSAMIHILAAMVDRVDNGHCTICGGFRGWEFKGERGFPGKCENAECLSHKISRLVPR